VTSRTRTVVTLGPATASESAIAACIEAGASVFRLNFSHGTHAEHGARIAAIRSVAAGRPIAILADLCGPKLRLTHPVRGKPGDVVALELPGSVLAGDPVLLADGAMALEVIDPTQSRVVTGGDIPAGKGINLPSSRLDDVPSVTDKDREDMRFAVGRGVDFLGLSFVRTASDLDEPRATGLPVIAKFEKAAAIEHMESIVRLADGVMVARGDLGVEIPIERVPIVQKQLIAMANRYGKPVITATQMLRSMVDSRMPTRAEATDVANAVLDGTDAVMLSEETAVGRYPVEAVRMMGRITDEVERMLPGHIRHGASSGSQPIADAACSLAYQLSAAAIVVLTRSGFTASQVARLRPRVPVLAMVPDEAVRRRLALVWGVIPIEVPMADAIHAAPEFFRETIRASGLLPEGAQIVITAGWPFGKPGSTNLIHVTSV